MGAITARLLGRVFVVALFTISSAPCFAAEIYIGIAPTALTMTGGVVPSPGTLLVADDVNPPVASVLGDTYAGEDIGYGGLAFDSLGTLWATVGTDSTLEGNEYGTLASTLIKVDPISGALIEEVGAVTYLGIPLGIADLAVQPGSNQIYGVSSPFDTQCDACLFQIDSSSGAATLVSTPKDGANRVQAFTIGFAPDGTLYSGGFRSGDSFQYDSLFKLNLTGDQVVGNLGFICGEEKLFDNQTACPSGIGGFAYVTQGMAVRSDGTIFVTLLDDNHEIAFYDAATNKWHNLGDTGIPVTGSVLADLDFKPAAIAAPVPASIWLFGSGLAALLGLRRRRT
jgi:hypothetical protein